MRRRTHPRSQRPDPVPSELASRIDDALRAVESAHEHARMAAGRGVALAWRREADAELDRAYLEADRLLREATRMAREHSYHAWMDWRTKLSWLDQRHQEQLFAVADRPARLQLGSVRAVDSGMTKPLIGEMAHGASKPAGAPARYGLDVEAVLRATDALPSAEEQLALRKAGAGSTRRPRTDRVSRADATERSAGQEQGSEAADLPPAA